MFREVLRSVWGCFSGDRRALLFISIVFLGGILTAPSLQAQESQHFEVPVSVSVKRKNANGKNRLVVKEAIVACSLESKEVGRLQTTRDGGQVFRHLKLLLKTLKQKVQAGRSSIRLNNRINLYRALLRLDVCSSHQSSGGLGVQPEPTPTAFPTISPSPSPSPTAADYFDSEGNVTEAGKVAFRIPSGINANHFDGEVEYNELCGTCHEFREGGYRFDQLQALANSVMEIPSQSLTDQRLADIIAYLNRPLS